MAQNVTVLPASAQAVAWNGTQAFEVTANNGFVVSPNVAGTCPSGTWSGATYTTAAIDANCTAIFNGRVPTYVVTPGGGNVVVSPAAPQTIVASDTAAFTVSASPNYTLLSAVGGTCAAGSWNAGVYTTGAITADCTVTFSSQPTFAIAHPAIRTTSLTISGGNSIFHLAWDAPVDGLTDATDQNYTLCTSGPNPANGTFSSVSQVLAGHCTSQIGTTTGTVTLAEGNSYYINVVVTDSAARQKVYQPKGEIADSSMFYYAPFEGSANDLSGATYVAASYGGTIGTLGTTGNDRYGNANNAYVFAGNQNNCIMTNQPMSGLTGTSPHTLTFWMRAGTNSNTIAPITMGGAGAMLQTGDHFGLITDGSLQHYAEWFYGKDLQSPSTGYDNLWHMYALTYTGLTGTLAALYRDGVLQISQNTGWTTPPSTAAGPLLLGCGPDGTLGSQGTLQHFFTGEIATTFACLIKPCVVVADKI